VEENGVLVKETKDVTLDFPLPKKAAVEVDVNKKMK